MPPSMSRSEREEFLAGVHVGVLSVAQAIMAAGRFSLCVQDEQPPYKYVTVEGPATIEDATDAERLELARRYLGTEGGDAYLAATPTDGQIMIRMIPERWVSVDYGQG
jgi:hypothetical protein